MNENIFVFPRVSLYNVSLPRNENGWLLVLYKTTSTVQITSMFNYMNEYHKHNLE